MSVQHSLVARNRTDEDIGSAYTLFISADPTQLPYRHFESELEYTNSGSHLIVVALATTVLAINVRSDPRNCIYLLLYLI
jgi:hypothetical protein